MHARCRPGSVLMVDDYRFFSAGVEAAVDRFLAGHPSKYELLEPIAAAGRFCALRRRA
jgi:O-methyltransferase